jgi:hypothetical protein
MAQSPKRLLRPAENALVEAQGLVYGALAPLLHGALQISVGEHARAAKPLHEARQALYAAAARLDSVLRELAVAEAGEVLP